MDVKTAGRTVDLFEAFARKQSPLTLSEIGRILNVPSSSCFNLVRALESRGYLYTVGPRRTIYPTRRLHDVANNIMRGEPVIKRIEPALEWLRDETRETVILGTLQGTRAIYLSVFEGTQTIRYIAHAGDRKPLHSSAIGKVLMSSLSETERAKLLGKLQLDAVTKNTMVDPDVLMQDFAASEKRGYARSVGENVADVMAFAMAVRLDGSTYAIAVAGPMERMRPQEEQLVAALATACERSAD